MSSTPQQSPFFKRTTEDQRERFTDHIHAVEEADSILDCLTSHEGLADSEIEHAIAGVRRLLQGAVEGLCAAREADGETLTAQLTEAERKHAEDLEHVRADLAPAVQTLLAETLRRINDGVLTGPLDRQIANYLDGWLSAAAPRVPALAKKMSKAIAARVVRRRKAVRQ